MEPTAFTGSTLDTYFTPHQFNKLLADSKPKARAAIIARNGCICLRESLKKICLLFCSHANACVGDAETEFDTRICLLNHLNSKLDLPLFGKFHRIIDQIE